MTTQPAIDRVGTANIRVTLSLEEAIAALLHVLEVGRPGLLGVQEWGHPLVRLPDGYLMARAGGGGPVVYQGERYRLHGIRGVVIAAAQDVGHLAGRRDHLGASILTVAIFDDQETDEAATLANMHLTAEVQLGKVYRADPDHRLRVERHKDERRGIRHELAAVAGAAYLVGDTNFDGMKVAGMRSCWDSAPHLEGAGTLGGRTPDYVYGRGRATHVQVIPTASDHDAVVATYPRRNA